VTSMWECLPKMIMNTDWEDAWDGIMTKLLMEQSSALEQTIQIVTQRF